MLWYNILEDNKGIISHILRFDPIAEGYIVLSAKLVALKRGNYELISIVKRTEWRKFIDYSGLSIEAHPSRVHKKNIYFVHVGYIPILSSIQIRV